VPEESLPLTGAIFTTDSTCSGVDLNIYTSKSDVYLDGGPQSNGPSLPPVPTMFKSRNPMGHCWARAWEPSNPTPLVVASDGSASCIQLSNVLIKTAITQLATMIRPMLAANIRSGRRKTLLSPNDGSKTDNFKVNVNSNGQAVSITE